MFDSALAPPYHGVITEEGGGPVKMISGSCSDYSTLTTREVADF